MENKWTIEAVAALHVAPYHYSPEDAHWLGAHDESSDWGYDPGCQRCQHPLPSEADFRAYEQVRADGRWNMYSRQAQQATGLDDLRYTQVQVNYPELMNLYPGAVAAPGTPKPAKRTRRWHRKPGYRVELRDSKGKAVLFTSTGRPWVFATVYMDQAKQETRKFRHPEEAVRWAESWGMPISCMTPGIQGVYHAMNTGPYFPTP
jgi:hypothetical protein